MGSPASLRQRFLGGFAWIGSTKVLTSVLGVFITLVLARLLEPGDFGLLAMATVFTGLVEPVKGFGIVPALIQRETVSDRNLKVGFTVALIGSSVVYVLIFLCAEPIGWFYNDARVVPVLRVSGLAILASAFTVVPRAMLRRNLTLRGEAIASVCSVLAGSSVTILLAWRGYGVWALVAGKLLSITAESLGLAFASPWRPGLMLRGGDARSLVRFGSGMSLSSYLWYAYSNVDFMIVGRMVGVSALGIYTMAWNLAKMPLDRISVAISPLVLPAFSRTRSDPRRLGQVLCRITRYHALLIFPLVGGIGAVAADAVPLLLGEKWNEVVGPLRLLALYGMSRGVIMLLPPMLQAANRLKQLIVFHVACVIALPIGFVVGLSWGVVGVAFAWAVIYPLLAAILLVPPALEVAELRIGSYLGSFVRPLAATVVMVSTVVLARETLPLSGFARLTAIIVLGAVAYAVSVRILEGPVLSEIRTLYRDAKVGMRA